MGAGLMLTLIFATLSADGNERRNYRKSGNRGPSLVSNPLTVSLKQVSFIEKI